MQVGWLFDNFTTNEFTEYCVTYCKKNLNDKLQNMQEEIAMHFTEYTYD